MATTTILGASFQGIENKFSILCCPSQLMGNFRFIALFYFGEMLGALLAFPFSDGFGRKSTLIYASIGCICMLIWCTITESGRSSYSPPYELLIGFIFALFTGANVLSSRFCMGWCMGVLMATAPVYTSEVGQGGFLITKIL